MNLVKHEDSRYCCRIKLDDTLFMIDSSTYMKIKTLEKQVQSTSYANIKNKVILRNNNKSKCYILSENIISDLTCEPNRIFKFKSIEYNKLNHGDVELIVDFRKMSKI